jgi:hypothetical protein
VTSDIWLDTWHAWHWTRHADVGSNMTSNTCHSNESTSRWNKTLLVRMRSSWFLWGATWLLFFKHVEAWWPKRQEAGHRAGDLLHYAKTVVQFPFPHCKSNSSTKSENASISTQILAKQILLLAAVRPFVCNGVSNTKIVHMTPLWKGLFIAYVVATHICLVQVIFWTKLHNFPPHYSYF